MGSDYQIRTNMMFRDETAPCYRSARKYKVLKQNKKKTLSMAVLFFIVCNSSVCVVEKYKMFSPASRRKKPSSVWGQLERVCVSPW